MPFAFRSAMINLTCAFASRGRSRTQPHPAGQLRRLAARDERLVELVELVVLVDVEVAHVLLPGLAPGGAGSLGFFRGS